MVGDKGVMDECDPVILGLRSKLDGLKLRQRKSRLATGMTKKDVDDVAISILQHRIVKNFKAQANNITNKDIIHHVLSELN